LAHIQRSHGLTLNTGHSRAATEQAGYVILPMDIVTRRGHDYQESRMVLALGHDTLISVEPPAAPAALDYVAQHMMHDAALPANADNNISPSLILLTLLEALNDDARATMTDVAAQLDMRSHAVAAASGGFDTTGQQPGVADIADTAIALGEAEELIAKLVENQLMLARASRWLRRMNLDQQVAQRLPLLLADIHGLRQYARFQHDKIRNLQQSLMTTLDLKQNQIIKVFTVVTAVFTPPTLIAAFYGQNFAHMPELEIAWGEWLMIAMTGVFALLPLAYVKRKGWMR